MVTLMSVPTASVCNDGVFYEMTFHFAKPDATNSTSFYYHVKATQNGVIEAGFYSESELKKGVFVETPLEEAPDWFAVLQDQLASYLAGEMENFTTVPIDWDYIEAHYQAPFHKTLWRTLLNVPYGKTLTYAQLAEQAGSPKAARAVGQGMRANPIPLLIPCHRVVASSNAINNGLGGFMGHREGFCIDIKSVLLNKEGHNYN